MAQTRKRQIPLRTLNHTLTVSDVKRATEFYQGLLAANSGSIRARYPARIGDGPQFIFLGGGGASLPSPASITSVLPPKASTWTGSSPSWANAAS